MKTISIDEVRNNLDNYLSKPQPESFVIMKKGSPVAVMNLIIEQEEVERILLANDVNNPRHSSKSFEQEEENKEEAFWQYIDDLYNPY